MSETRSGDRSACISWLYLALGLVQAAHSVEEVLTGLWKYAPVLTGMIREQIPSFPIVNWSQEGFAAANLVVVAVILGLSPFVFLNRPWARKMAVIVALIEILNAVNHLLPAILMRAYYPGSVSAVFLLGVSILLLSKIRKNHE